MKFGDRIVSKLPRKYQNLGKQFLKFGVTGTIGAIVDFGTYNLLVRGAGLIASYTVLGQQISYANSISVFLAIISNFIFNKYWTFRDTSKQVMKQWIGFFAFNAVTWALNQLLFSVLVNQVALIENIFGDQKDNAAKALAIGIILFINFGGSKLLIFRKQDKPSPQVIGPTTSIKA